MADQALLHSSSEMPPVHICSNLISKLVVSPGASVMLTSPAPSVTEAAEVPLHAQFQQTQQQQQQQMFTDDHIDTQLLGTGEVFQVIHL